MAIYSKLFKKIKDGIVTRKELDSLEMTREQRNELVLGGGGGNTTKSLRVNLHIVQLYVGNNGTQNIFYFDENKTKAVHAYRNDFASGLPLFLDAYDGNAPEASMLKNYIIHNNNGVYYTRNINIFDSHVSPQPNTNIKYYIICTDNFIEHWKETFTTKLTICDNNKDLVNFVSSCMDGSFGPVLS